ncbi:MAG: hypothetical protein H6733_00965 [Alphaproteobacteria bacterium]|nr:hypothetical protein [Alphaproteobacteria bacterium]
MATPFTQWSARIAEARDEHARRALLGEIGLWRAQRLGDLVAQRDAAYALSVVYERLGEHPHAVHEADQLVALCRTAPPAPREVFAFAERFARRLHTPAPAPAASARPDPAIDDALAAARSGRWAEARALSGHKRGPRHAMFRVWTQLGEAMAAEGDERESLLTGLLDELGRRFEPAPTPAPQAAPPGRPARGEAPARAERAARPAKGDDAPRTRAPAPDVTDGPLVALVGGPVPSDRDALVDALEAWLADHPDQLDALCAAALTDHVRLHGARAVAPWLVGFTARALAAADAPATRAALAEHAGAYAVTAYDEDAFAVTVAVLAAAGAAGHTFAGLRRGVLRRGMPADRRVWTLRLRQDATERLVAVVPAVEAPWKEGTPERLADRLAHLSDRVLVVAAGAAHEPLRAAAAAAGLGVLDTTDAAAIVAALPDVPVREAPPAPEPAPQAAGARASRATERPAAPRPDPEADLAAAFTEGQATDAGAYAPALAGVRRAWRAFAAIRDAVASMTPAEIDSRLPAFLEAVHLAAPADVRLAEGMTVVLRIAAAVPGGGVEAVLARGDAVSERFGGPRLLGLVQVARTLTDAGWSIRRVLIGVTRREERTQPALGALAREVHGLWRLVVARDDHAGEVWWIDAPSPEARAAAPLLYLDARNRVVVIAPDEDAAAWPAPPAPTQVLPWTPEAGAALAEAVSVWPAGGADDDGDTEA